MLDVPWQSIRESKARNKCDDRASEGNDLHSQASVDEMEEEKKREVDEIQKRIEEDIEAEMKRLYEEMERLREGEEEKDKKRRAAMAVLKEMHETLGEEEYPAMRREIERLAECLSRQQTIITLIESNRHVYMMRNHNGAQPVLKLEDITGMAVDEERIIKSCENVDPIIALSYLDIYAPTINVGTVWCGFATAMAQQIPELCDMFEIPTGYRLNYVMLLGTPDIEYTRTIQPEPFSIKEIR